MIIDDRRKRVLNSREVLLDRRHIGVPKYLV